MKIQIPGKTFLVGEYSVLLGGSALGLATAPCFQVSSENIKEPFVFHPDSPAGRYLKKHNKSVNVSIADPYLGGFGRSTAEYIAVIAEDLIDKQQIDFSKTIKEYKELHSGSGMDLAFQYFGQVCLVDPLIGFYQTFTWHFENLDFYILSTGLKIPTHEHLQNLDAKSLQDLPPLSNKITQVYAENKEFEFLALMKQWCMLLNSHGLMHTHSLEMKQKLETYQYIKLAKPCGALGADVMLVFFAKGHRESVKEYLTENNFRIQAHSSDLAEGVAGQLFANRRQNVD